jgi:restriction system protein
VDSDSTKLVESTDSVNSDVIERLRENLDGYEFEEFVAELWRRRGWNARVTRGSGDGNIDVVAEHDMVTGEKRTNREMIQAKHKSKGNTVGVGTVRRTKGSEVVEPQDNLVVVTTGTFTSGAREAAEKNNVELVDKEKLREMVVENMGDNRWE